MGPDGITTAFNDANFVQLFRQYPETPGLDPEMLRDDDPLDSMMEVCIKLVL